MNKELFYNVISKGSISLFCISFIVAAVCGLIALACSALLATIVALTWIGGTLVTMGIGKLASLVGMRLTNSDAAGVIGTIVAIILMLIL